MIGKEEARRIILSEAAASRRAEDVPLGLAFGRVLAADARADADLPPFERSSMDGWAVRAADVASAPATLRVLGAVHAGAVAPRPVGPGESWKIMTGAPLPEGADAVVVVEDSETIDGGRSVVLRRAARAWQNVSRRGEDARRGEVVLRAGTPLDAPALALLATIGADPAPTWAPPRVCVIPTGDELVDPFGPPPGPGQIRESNGVLLEAQVRQVSAAIPVVRPGIARDDRASLDRFLDVGLDHDVLILSGGVSMGDKDLVGAELVRRGLEVLVDKVSIKPGKPLLFGRLRRANGDACRVFGLPGNPVSSFVTFELFVRPFLQRWLGVDDPLPDVVQARLVSDRELKAIPRTQHLPAALWCGDDGALSVRPLTWHGSGDMLGIVDANAMIVIGEGAAAPRPGDVVRVERLANRPIRSGQPASRA